MPHSDHRGLVKTTQPKDTGEVYTCVDATIDQSGDLDSSTNGIILYMVKMAMTAMNVNTRA